MQQQRTGHWLAPIIVALVGFTTGFLFVYMLRGREPEIPPDEATSGGLSAAAATTAPTARGETPQASAPGSPGAQGATGTGAQPSPDGGSAPDARTTTGPSTALSAAGGPAQAGTAGAPAEATDPSPAAAAPPSAGPDATPSPAGGAAGGGGVAAAAPPDAAGGAEAGADRWTALLGKRCRLDLGDIDALVVRGGNLRHGQEVLWRRDIGSQPRIGRIRRGDPLTVVPLAFGFRPGTERPSAAYMRLERSEGNLEGIVPLRVGGRYVEVTPGDNP